MRKWILASSALALLAGGVAVAQQPVDIRPVRDIRSLGDVSPTPEMWFYEQYMEQYQDPQMAVRKKAEYRTEQRERRLAAMKWFGMSNSRPRCGTDPYNGDYSPYWASNNRWFPYQWNGTGANYVVVPSTSSAK